MSDYFVVEPCQSAGGFEIRLSGKKIDIEMEGGVVQIPLNNVAKANLEIDF